MVAPHNVYWQQLWTHKHSLNPIIPPLFSGYSATYIVSVQALGGGSREVRAVAGKGRGSTSSSPARKYHRAVIIPETTRTSNGCGRNQILQQFYL